MAIIYCLLVLTLAILPCTYCTTCASCFTEIISGGKSEIRETLVPADALEIFNDHGAGKGNHVCQSLDGRSNKVYGEVVCERAIMKLFPEGNESLISRVPCELNVPIYQTVGKQLERIRKVFSVAKCTYGNNKHVYILNGPQKHFYYVVQYDSIADAAKSSTHSGDIIAVLYIVTNKNDNTVVQISETSNKLIADDIFGVYGSIMFIPKISINKHICQRTPNGVLVLKYENICEKAFDLTYFTLIRTNFELSKVETKCENIPIKREIVDVKSGQYLRTPSVLMAVCYYHHKEKQDKVYSFTVISGPTDYLFYIANRYNDGFGSVCEITAVQQIN